MSVPPYVFVGGVEVSHACLNTAIAMGLPPTLVIGYPNTLSAASGYVDMRPVAEGAGIPFIEAEDVNDPAIVNAIRDFKPRVGFAIGWSRLLGAEVLRIPELGWFGIHPTRLPEGRGRAPIPWTILKDIRETASTLFKLTTGVDDGPIVGSVLVPVNESDDAGVLYEKHLQAHADLFRSHLRRLLEGDVPLVPQDSASATYWPRRRPEDGRIEWSRKAQEVLRLIRAVTKPFPGAFSDTEKGRLIVWRGELAPSIEALAGTIIYESDGTALCQCQDQCVRALEYEIIRKNEVQSP